MTKYTILIAATILWGCKTYVIKETVIRGREWKHFRAEKGVIIIVYNDSTYGFEIDTTYLNKNYKHK